jgi:hypothetical protein
MTQHPADWQNAIPRSPYERPADLESRLSRIEDEHAIHDLLNRWSYFHDAGMLEEKLALHLPSIRVSTRTHSAVGAEAVRKHFSAGPPNDDVYHMRHYISNTTIRFEHADRAAVLSQAVWTQTLGGTPTRAAVGGGYYVDVVVRSGGQWLFGERAFHRTFDFVIPGVASFGELLINRGPGPSR